MFGCLCSQVNIRESATGNVFVSLCACVNVCVCQYVCVCVQAAYQEGLAIALSFVTSLGGQWEQVELKARDGVHH